MSVKWATCNIGASSPEDYGDYYAWGEVSTKSKYTLENYRFLTIVENNGRTKVSRYNSQSGRGTVDGKTILELSDDVARQKWGGDWRMPTNAEIQELIDKCNWSWTSKGGVNGYKVTSKINGYRNNSIFLPAAGNRLEDSLYDLGEEGYYWSSSISSIVSSDARYLNFSYSNRSSSNSSREFGQSVRPVCQ